MLTRSQLKDLARLRLSEAETLYEAGLYDGCVYLCGYAVELALKARICRVLRISEYPEAGELGRYFKTHSFDALKILAGVEPDLTVTRNPALFANWSLVTRWDVNRRYDVAGTQSGTFARELLDAIRQRPNGVLTWLSKRW